MYPTVEPPPRRILVKEVNWLGDLVMSLPALRAIRRSFPHARVSVLVKKELAGFFDGIRWIDEVIPYSVRGGVGGIGDRLSVVRAIRSTGCDLAVLFPNSFESALWVTMARVPRRAGYAKDGRGVLLTHRIKPPPHVMSGHQVHYWLAMVRNTIGAAGNAQDLSLTPDEKHLQSMRTWLDAHRKRKDARLIAVAPAAAFGPAKEWPADHFVKLIDSLGDHDAECVLVGAPGERALCDQIAAGTRSGAMVAAGDTGIGEIIALLALADGFVGNDSGAMHVAAALGRPTVGVFGSTNPERTGPLGPQTRVLWHRLDCTPCLQRTCRFGHYDCLKGTPPAHALSALRSLGAVPGR